MGISKNNTRNLLRYLLAGTACGFLLLLTVFVLKESGAQEALGDRRKEFLLFMAADVLLLLGLTFWSIRCNGQLQGFCTAGAMLLGIGALIVYADACPAEHEDSVLAALAAKTMLPVTLSHSIFKYESLLRRPAQYAKAVFDEIADVFGKMLYNNATTFYETVDGARAFGNAGSLCHAWSAIPTYLYHAYVLGLKPTENGFASYEIKPVDAGIHDAEGLVITPIGKITL
jgi:hypothetical protein